MTLPPRLRRALLASLLSLLPAPAFAAAPEDPAPAPAEGGRRGSGGEPAKVEELLELLRSRDAAVREAALREAADVGSPELLPPLARLLSDDAPSVRVAAAAALARRADPKERRSAASALEGRLRTLGEKGDAGERLALVEALHDLAQPSSVGPLVDGIRTDTPREEVEARLRAVANCPVPEAIEALIQFAASHGRGKRADWNAGTRAALRYATRADAGGADPDLWRAWWRKNERTFDFAGAAADRERERREAAEKERKREERKENPGKKREGGGRKDGGGSRGGGDGGEGGKKDGGGD